MEGKKINRAKQFMAFSPLKGYYDLILEKQQTKEEKRILDEEDMEKIYRKLNKLEIGDKIHIKWYKEYAYIEEETVVREIDKQKEILKTINNKMSFEDIYQIRKINIDTKDY